MVDTEGKDYHCVEAEVDPRVHDVLMELHMFMIPHHWNGRSGPQHLIFCIFYLLRNTVLTILCLQIRNHQSCRTLSF